MSDPVRRDFLDPRQSALVMEIYRAALRVEAELPTRHVASIAARKIIAAFRSGTSDSKKSGRRIAPAATGSA